MKRIKFEVRVDDIQQTLKISYPVGSGRPPIDQIIDLMEEKGYKFYTIVNDIGITVYDTHTSYTCEWIDPEDEENGIEDERHFEHYAYKDAVRYVIDDLYGTEVARIRRKDGTISWSRADGDLSRSIEEKQFNTWIEIAENYDERGIGWRFGKGEELFIVPLVEDEPSRESHFDAGVDFNSQLPLHLQEDY